MSLFSKTPTRQPTLKDLGYRFNRDCVLVDRKGSRFKFTNQRDYEALGEAITEDVYVKLEELGLRKVTLTGTRSFFFANQEVFSAPKILILIHGNGVVRAGQWARKLIINDGLNEGSQLEFIKKAHEEGYAVIVTNTNQNVEYLSKEEHASLVWKQMIKRSPCQHVVIIAHSYGGQVTMDLAKRFPEDFLTKVKGIYLTDSAHNGITSRGDVKRKLRDISLNFVTSTAPLNTPVSSYGDIRCVSAETTSHDWTSFRAFRSIFEEIRNLDIGQNAAFGQSGWVHSSAQTAKHEKPRRAKGDSDGSESGFEEERKVEVRDVQGGSIGIAQTANYEKPRKANEHSDGFESGFGEERKVEVRDSQGASIGVGYGSPSGQTEGDLTDGVWREPGQETIQKYE